MMTFVEVGQDDDVRDPAKASHGLHRSGDRRLAVHLRLEKAQQQFPDQRPLHRLPAVLVAQRLAEAAVVNVEKDVMALVLPFAQGNDTVTPHLARKSKRMNYSH